MQKGQESSAAWIVRAALVLFWLFSFVVSVNLIALGFKHLGHGFAEILIETTADPLTGLFIGILATGLVQSSSTTTSLIVGLAGGGALTLSTAIPMIMGANVGTTITNTIVSVGHIRQREEFQRAFAASTVHDMFNLLTIVVLFPVEQVFGIIQYLANEIGQELVGLGGLELASPLKVAIGPVIGLISRTLGSIGWLEVIVALVLLVLSLTRLVKLLRTLVLGRIEHAFSRTFFSKPARAFALGVIVTILVQSSSITTSVIVPLAGAGLLTLVQIYPFTLGANVGTTVTAWLAALSIGNPVGLTVAIAHFLFNSFGIMIFWPLKHLPLRLAEGLARRAVVNRLIPVAYIVGVFFLLPLVVYWLR